MQLRPDPRIVPDFAHFGFHSDFFTRSLNGFLWGHSFVRMFQGIAAGRSRGSVELHPPGRLIGTGPARNDIGAEVVFPSHRRTRDPAHDRELADMRERVRDRSLAEPPGRCAGGDSGSEEHIERLHRTKEALHVRLPLLRSGVVPDVRSFGKPEGPVHEVSHVGEYLGRGARSSPEAQPREVRRRLPEHLFRPVGERRKCVTEETDFSIRVFAHGCLRKN